MKVEKFMCEVTKAILNDKRVRFWEYGDKVIISPNGFFAMIIPKIRNIFNHEISKNHPIPCDWNSHKLKDTAELKKIDKKTVRIFETDEGKKVQVDEKYLNYFDKYSDFYGNSPKTPVYIKENGVLCGIIMPIVNRGK